MPDDTASTPEPLPRVPLGPQGVDRNLVTKTLDLEVRQVSRADLAAWLTLAEEDATYASLIVTWREGTATSKYGGNADDRDGPFGPQIESIEQVEEVTSVNYNATYGDDSQLTFWLMIGSTATARCRAKRENSQAQGIAYALRNKRRQSSAVTREAIDLKLISRLAFGVLFVVAAWLLGSIGIANLPSLQGWLKIVTSLAYGVLLAYAGSKLLARASRRTSVPKPLILEYKDPSSWKTEKPWFFVFGFFTVIAAIAAWIVVFYSPN